MLESLGLMDLVPPQEAPPAGLAALNTKNGNNFTAFHVTIILVGILLCVVMCAIPWDNMKCCSGSQQNQEHHQQEQQYQESHVLPDGQVILQVIQAQEADVDDDEEHSNKRRRHRGLSKKVIQSFKVVRYHCQSGKVSSSECMICLGEFRNGQKVRLLPGCSHGFHKKCIQQWLLSHTSCPICRNALVPEISDEKHHLHYQQEQQVEHEQHVHSDHQVVIDDVVHYVPSD